MAAWSHGVQPSKLLARTLVAFGGAAPLHAARFAGKLGIVRAFEEDRAMVSAQWQNILRDPLWPMQPLAMDRAPIHCRSVHAQALAAPARSGAAAVPSIDATPIGTTNSAAP